jgi:hypothetical protein
MMMICDTCASVGDDAKGRCNLKFFGRYVGDEMTKTVSHFLYALLCANQHDTWNRLMC